MLKVINVTRVEDLQEESYDIVVADQDQQLHDGRVYVGDEVLEFEIPELCIFACGQPSIGMVDVVDVEFIQMALNEFS